MATYISETEVPAADLHHVVGLTHGPRRHRDTFDSAVNGDTAHPALLDAKGQGLEASRMANVAVSSSRHSRRTGLSLTDTAVAIDEVVQECCDASRYVAGQLATMGLTTGMFRMLNMGHPLPLLISSGRVVDELPSEPMLPAGCGDKPAADYEHRLQPGDDVLMRTDGITEAKHQDGDEYGRERLVGLIETVLAVAYRWRSCCGRSSRM